MWAMNDTMPLPPPAVRSVALAGHLAKPAARDFLKRYLHWRQLQPSGLGETKRNSGKSQPKRSYRSTLNLADRHNSNTVHPYPKALGSIYVQPGASRDPVLLTSVLICSILILR